MENSTLILKQKVINYLQNKLLKNKNIESISESLPLITGGLMDSISTMQLITFLETEFHIEFEAHEVDKDNFDTVNVIVELVESKLHR